MKKHENQRDDIELYHPFYAIWAKAAENGPLSGQYGFLTEEGKALVYSEQKTADLKLHDILNLCVNKKPAAEYQVVELQGQNKCAQFLPLEAIREYDLIPDFEPLDYELRDQVYGNTGGGCMVGTVEIYLPSLNKTVWANCSEESVTITSADCTWNEDQSESWKRYEDVLLFDVNFRTNQPENIGVWLPVVREALTYTIEQQTGKYGMSFCLPAEWIPDTYRESANKNYLAWVQNNCVDVTISPGGGIAHSEYCMQERHRMAGGKKLIYVASPYAGNTEYNIEFAKQACRTVMESGHAFFAPHLLYPAILDDAAPEQREMGMKMGISVLSRCDELWVFGDTISKGMQAEIDAANHMGIPVQYMTLVMEQEQSGLEMQTPC